MKRKTEKQCPVCHGQQRFLFKKNGYDIYRCHGCGLGTTHPMPSKAAIAEMYNLEDYYSVEDGSHGYSDYSALELGHRKEYRNIFLYAREKYGFDFGGSRVLDIGCAKGHFLDEAKETGCAELWGTDITLNNEDVLKAKGHTFMAGAFEDLEIPERYFDFIFMGDVFEHFYDPFLAVRKLSKILRDGGLIALTTVDFDSLFARVMGQRWRLVSPIEHLYYWSGRSLSLLFDQNGFNVKCKPYTLYIPIQYLNDRFRLQFGFNPVFIKLLPIELFPIRSFDTTLCFLEKRPAGY